MDKAFDKEILLQGLSHLKAKTESFQVSTQQTLPKCSKCEDRKFIVTGHDENGYELYSNCECKIQHNQQMAFNSSRITESFKLKTFDNFDLVNRSPLVRNALQVARTYAHRFEQVKDDQNSGICLLGNPGSGKTHLLMAICNHIMQNQYTYNGKMRAPSVLYFPWVESFTEIRNDLSTTDDRVRKMQEVDLLFIDDMWKGRKEPTALQLEVAFAVINNRYMEKKPTMISSERDIDEMCDFDEALGSRINEMCKNFRLIMKGGKELNYRLADEVWNQ